MMTSDEEPSPADGAQADSLAAFTDLMTGALEAVMVAQHLRRHQGWWPKLGFVPGSHFQVMHGLGTLGGGR